MNVWYSNKYNRYKIEIKKSIKCYLDICEENFNLMKNIENKQIPINPEQYNQYMQYNIKEDRETLIKWINRLLNYDFTIKIPKYSVKKHKEVKINKTTEICSTNTNWIFDKEKKPNFLLNNIFVDLGIYILEHTQTKYIGSINFDNSYSYPIKYEIKQNMSNSIIAEAIGNELCKNESMNIKFRLVKKLNHNEKIENKFYIKLINENGECDECKVSVLLNAVPLCLKFKLNEKYHIDENNNISINHYANSLLLEHQFPGNYSSDSLGLIIKSNENNRYHNINVKQQTGKLMFNLEKLNNKLTCSSKISVNLKNINLININLNFISPIYDSLIIYDKNKINIQSINLVKGYPKSFYLFNMSISPININYKYNNNNLILSEEIKTIYPGEKKKLIIENNKVINLETLYINDNKIDIITTELPKLIIKSYIYYYGHKSIYCDCLSKSTLSKLKFIGIDSKYCIFEKKIIEKNEIERFDNICSCYLLYNNKIIDSKENKTIKHKIRSNVDHDIVYGFRQGDFYLSIKGEDADIVLKLDTCKKWTHIFNIEERNKFSSKLNDKEFINNLQSDDLSKINESLGMLIEREFKLYEIINTNINYLETTENKTSIPYIILYLTVTSNNYDIEGFVYFLKKIIHKLFKINILIPYFEVNSNLDEDIKQFMQKISYIISFVDIVVNPRSLNNSIIDYINNNNSSNETTTDNDKILSENFNKCFNNGVHKDHEHSELIYYNNKIYKHTSNDDFNNFSNQVVNSKYDNNDFNKENIRNFVQTYKKEIQDNMEKIINNEVNISNIFNTLDECIRIVSKTPLILSTIEDDAELFYFVSNYQKIYDFTFNLIYSPIYKTYFSKKISSTFKEIENALSKYNFFDLKANEAKEFNESNDYRIRYIEQCEIPSDSTYENHLSNNNDVEEKSNRNTENDNRNYKSNIHFDNSKYTSKNSEDYKGDISNNSGENEEERVYIKPKDEVKPKMEYVSNSPVLNDDERAEIVNISIPFLNDVKQTKDDNKFEEININNDLDNDNENIHNEREISMDILEKQLSKTSPTNFLKMIMKTIKYEHQSLSEIKFTKLITKGINENENFKYCFDCSQASSYIQSTLSNIIKSNNKFVDDNKILPNSLIDSFIDIAVDITHMSQIQRIAALVISTGLSIPLKHYGVNIRISVFGERNGVWTLSKDFSTDIETQLARLRDALTSKKRFMSFPADALYSLKKDWIKRFNNKNPDQRTSYTSVLISSLISPQVVDDKIDWSQDISNNIIVFGLKSEFDKTFMNEHKVYEELLKIPTTKSNSITQKFLEPKNVVGQSESERSLLEELCKSLVMSCFYNSGDKDNFKEYKVTFNNTKNNTVSEITSIKNISKFINNNMEDKTFTQSISHNMTDISRINEEFKPPNIPLPSTSEVWSHTQYNDMGSVGNFKNTVESILKTEFGLAFPLNTSSNKVPSASGGTISIPALRKWIVSGFTYKEIFLKKGGKTKRKYSITFAIDLSSSIHLSCNYSHAIATILILLLGPATLQDNEEIKIDVIISTLNGPKIMFLSSKANTFESISCINSIINVIDNETPNYCMPGNTLNAAYQLQLQKGGVDIGKNIFFITDSYVTSRKEIKFANSIINSCEIAGIELMTFGVGSYPSGIKQLYPKCCYAPSLIGLGDAIAFIYAISRYSPGSEIIPQVIMENTSDEIQNNLIKMINQPPENKELQESIENKHMDYIELLGNPETMTINEENLKLENKNPIIEPYYDGLFSGFNILVVILYLGGEVYQGKIRDRNVTINQFESGPGKALKRKGFNYKLVFSYGEAVDELAKSEGGRYPYIETWIFCSRGDGTLPKVAKDKDTNKIIPFLQCVTEFNNNGGGLLLFCDNEPFTFEANILLSEYLNFEDNNGNKVKPKFTMKGNYDQPDINKKYIKAMDPNNNNKSKNGKFKSETTLPSPGINDIRMSLRPGLIEFSEGKTLSYAECENGSEDYSPFTVFAYLTDTSKERPFILYYDPKMKDKEINQGPIVVHGGFTSAFYDFSYDGTGRLVTSIACWLVRYEERNLKQILNNMDIEMVKDVPAIPKPNYTGEKFTKFININNPNYANYSILILDISGSMVPYYESLINMANDIINNQLKNKNNKGVIIFFADSAKAVINGNYRTLTNNDIYSANVGGATNFHEAFTEAVKYINPPGIYNKRLLFLTDGESDSSRLKPLCNQISNAGFSIHILGFGDESLFSHLKQFVRGNGTFQAYSNFINVYDSAIKIFTTEDDN